MNKRILAMIFTATLCCATFTACGHDNKSPAGDVPTDDPVLEAPAPEQPPEQDAPAVSYPAQAEYILVCANALNVRTGAGTGYASLGQVEKGVLLHYDGETDGWYKTLYRGKTAYVSANPAYSALTQLEESSEEVEAVIHEGLKVLGTPYVYGAVRLHDGKGNFLKNFSDDAFDCSSLMQYIFYRGAGVLLDVTTRTQISQGTHVEYSELKRGDLMFFTNASRKDNVGLERVGHVALYLGGNYILHTASDYAKIEQISATRRSYFIEARRII